MSKELEALNRIKYKLSSTKANGYWEDLDIIETALECKEKLEKAIEIIKENLNIDEILLAIKGVCKASDYDLAKEILRND